MNQVVLQEQKQLGIVSIFLFLEIKNQNKF